MFEHKKGISTIVTVIILVALVLVVIGIFWATAVNIVEEQTENVNVAERCLGIVLTIESVDCTADACNVTVKRSMGSATTEIDGVKVDLSSETAEKSLAAKSGNVVTTKQYSWPNNGIEDPTSGTLRFYFNDENGEPVYCSQVVEWTAE